MPLKGNAVFKYDAGAGVQTVTLNFPLYRADPSRFHRRFVTENLAGTAAEVLTVGVAQNEITATCRFIDNPTAVLAMLEAGANGVQLDYYPDNVGAPATFIPARLIEPTGDLLQLSTEIERISFGEYSVVMRLRRVDGGDWSDMPGMNIT